MARSVWSLVDDSITEHICNSSGVHAPEFIFTMIETLSEQEQAKCFVTLCAIWYAKRKVIQEEIYQNPLSMYAFVQNFLAFLESLAEWKKKIAVQHPMHVPTVSPRWIAPFAGEIKINVDDVVSKNENKGVVAAVVRNVEGRFMGASSVVFEGHSDPETLEALACGEGLALSSDTLATRNRVISDC
jgi:hypothetical protein